MQSHLAMLLCKFPFYFLYAFTSTSTIPNFYNRATAVASPTLQSFVKQHRLQYVKKALGRHIEEMQDSKDQPKEAINWIIRPATVDDRDGCAELIRISYHTLLPKDYSDECLAKCLPLITTPREQLLTCNTWFVAEHPSTHQIVGCGGWTLRSPVINTTEDTVENKEAADNNNAEKFPSCINPDSPVPHLRHFATHPGFSRMGIASSIWHKICSGISKQFSDEGKPFPEIEVFSTLTAEGFYTSCGFEVVSRFDMNLAKEAVFPVILMRRRSAIKGS
jgi:hypothetical protein